MLLNLVHNAAEAMSADAGPREIEVRTALGDDDHVLVTVDDTGPPVPDETVERLFDPFFTTRPDGLGMGLPICHTIVEAHTGRLWAEKRPERGLSVRFTLPRHGGEA